MLTAPAVPSTSVLLFLSLSCGFYFLPSFWFVCFFFLPLHVCATACFGAKFAVGFSCVLNYSLSVGAQISGATSHEMKIWALFTCTDESRGLPQSSLAAVQRHGRHCSCYRSTCAARGSDACAGRALCGEPSFASWPATDFAALLVSHLEISLPGCILAIARV